MELIGAFAANVSMTEAIAYEGKNRFAFKAEDFKPAIHKNYKFYCKCCLEKGKEVQLRNPSMGKGPKGGYFQNLSFDQYDPQTGEPVLDSETKKQKIETRQYYFAPHFTTFPNQTHHDTCEAARNQKDLALAVQEMGGTILDSQNNIRFLGLNIPAGQKVITPERTVPSGSQNTYFNGVAAQHPVRRLHQGARRGKRPRHLGIASVSDIGTLLEATAADKGQRERILLRRGNDVLRLSELFCDDASRLYDRLHAREKKPEPDDRHAVAFLLTLSNAESQWITERDGSTSVKIKATKTAADGHRIPTTLTVNFRYPQVEEAFKDSFKAGDRSFLVYSEHTRIKSDKRSIKMLVFTLDQICAWSPQKRLDFGFDPVAKEDAPTLNPSLH